ncbi:hypothetical protein [Thalassotalea fusca]
MFNIILFVISCTMLLFSASSFAQSDPTRPLGLVSGGQQIVQKGALRLESIIHREQGKTAIVNGQMVKVGDTFGAYQVRAIGDKSITLESPERAVTLNLFSGVTVNSK